MAPSLTHSSLAFLGALTLAAHALAVPNAPATPATPPAPQKPAPAPAAPQKPAPAPAAPQKPAPAPPAAGPVKPVPVKLDETKPGQGASADDRAALATRIVVLERAGKPLALGVVLNGDGRIVGALSSLGGGRHVDARYSDGALVPLRIGHADRAHDLALMVPENARHKLGLKATQNSAATLSSPLGSFVAAGAKAAPGATLTPSGPSSVNGNDGQAFPEALTFGTPVAAGSVGGPLVNASGEVVAIVTRACEKKAGKACSVVLVGTPVSVVREFLRGAPKTAALPAPSLGVQVAAEDTGTARGLRITAARGPAAVAGLRAGADARTADVIVAIDGVPVMTPEALEHQVEDRAVGDVVDVLVLGSGRYRHVTLTVAAPPPR